jgi:hypothetical protein
VTSFIDHLYTQQVKVKVILRLTVSQSVCLGVVPHLGHMTRNLFIGFDFKKVAVLSMWAPSLTTGRVCRLQVSPLCDVFVRIIYNIFTKYIKCSEVFKVQYLQGLCQSRLSTADYALLLVAFATTGSLRHLNGLYTQPNFFPLINPRHVPRRKHCSSVAISIVACATIGADREENTVFQPVHWRPGHA